jgi:hypothetical protein
MYQMIKPHALQEFRRQVAAGVKRPRLPEGAFDVMHSRIRKRLAQDALSPSVKKALDAMSRPTRDAIRTHLTSRDQLPGTQDPDTLEQEMQGGEDQEMMTSPLEATPPPSLVCRPPLSMRRR